MTTFEEYWKTAWPDNTLPSAMNAAFREVAEKAWDAARGVVQQTGWVRLTNEARAAQAKRALQAHGSNKVAAEPLEEQITDLLADLHHLVRQQDADLDVAFFLDCRLATARRHFEAEEEEEKNERDEP